MLEKIISGGQTGVDIAGLQAAKDLNISTGGYMPKFFRTEEGNRPDYKDLYNIKECDSYNYIYIEQN